MLTVGVGLAVGFKARSERHEHGREEERVEEYEHGNVPAQVEEVGLPMEHVLVALPIRVAAVLKEGLVGGDARDLISVVEEDGEGEEHEVVGDDHCVVEQHDVLEAEVEYAYEYHLPAVRAI